MGVLASVDLKFAKEELEMGTFSVVETWGFQ